MSNSPSATPLTRSFFAGSGPAAGRSRVTQIGRYRLDSLIAVGGMGSIHFGVLTGAAEFSRLVAIKRLHPQLATDPLFRVRFVEEARLNARVLHSNVVQLLDVVQAEDELWLIMEYVDGVTLHSLQSEISTARRLLPLDVVAGVMGGVLEGLHAAHETRDTSGAPLRIVHRDVSPQNIMISRSGHVKLIDFGVAKATALAVVSTLGRLVGKISYMSPEQAQGLAVDQRSDVFSAGVVLWEALTGQRLFREAKQSHASVLRDVLRKPVPAPSTYRTEIPSALDAVALRALERNPSDRFSSAREFGQALEAALPLAPGSKISAYVTVFCEVSPATPHQANGLAPATALSPETAVTRVPTDQEEPTSLALTGVSEPLRLAAPRKPWHRRFGPYALLLVFLLVCVSLAHWAMRVPRSASNRAAEAIVLTSSVAAHTGKLARPVASFESPRPEPQRAIVAGSRTLMPQPPTPTAPVEVRSLTVLRKISEPRTRRPRVVRPSPPRTVTPPTSTQTTTAEPLVSERDDCSVTTYLGPDGIQHFKEQCL
jgi:serine/threonine protein kinase